MEPSSDEQAIRNLLYRYMEATDAGDFAARGELFEHATVWFPEPIGARRGAEVRELFRTRQRLYDGIPRTAHLCTNVIIDIDDTRASANVRSRYLVLQETDELPLQPIIVGRYHDRFERVDGRWRFAERRFLIDLVGEMSAHQNPGIPSAKSMRSDPH
ncbi:MAG TPA: nuclear transport factor 2 family protein [Acidimicrobiales bacterium]|jgi:3-phenylpropionate/cinnamic acid dioxygenase small subunit|nr:nuclear transport factor 2 family protein [Acidimicrobiales bacterium]